MYSISSTKATISTLSRNQHLVSAIKFVLSNYHGRAVAVRSVLLILAVALPMLGCGDTTPGGEPKKNLSAQGVSDSASGTSPVAADSAAAAFTQAPALNDSTTRHTLKVTPKTGDIYRYRLTQKNDKEQNGLRLKQTSVFNFTTKITGINSDGSFTLEMRYDSIRIDQAMPPNPMDSVGKTLHFDSRNKLDPSVPGASDMKALIGQRVNITVQNNGKISDVANVDPIISQMLGAKKDSISPQQRAMLKDAVKLQYYGVVLPELFLQFVPDTGVMLGNSWKRLDTLPIGGLPAASTITYRLAEIRSTQGGAVGSVKVALTATFPKKNMENKVLTAVINDAKVKGGGEALVNLTNGFPVRKSTSIEAALNMTLTAKAGPQKGISQQMSQKENSSTLVELIEYQPGTGAVP